MKMKSAKNNRQKKIPKRMCVSCREMKDKTDLLRLLIVEKELLIDTKAKQAGRGFYLCTDTECLDKFVKKKNLATLLKRAVSEVEIQDLTLSVGRALEDKRKQQSINKDEEVGLKNSPRKLHIVPLRRNEN